jgi:tryptophanyl-tRNA synthetase
MAKILTGIQSTGTPHLGNILGAIIPAVKMANSSNEESYLFIANMHSLTQIKDQNILKENTFLTAATWLAFDLDSKKSCFFRQSDVPEVTELAWYLSCFFPYQRLKLAHSFKDKSDNLKDVNSGLFSYPMLMSADILMYDANIVPVGKDQLQHLEMTRDVASRFNNLMGETFIIPEAKVQDDTNYIIGTDGEKMSKSKSNIIDIFLDDKKLRKQIMKIQTQSLSVEEAKNPDQCNVFKLFKVIASEDEVKKLHLRYTKGGIGYGEAKELLYHEILNRFSINREKFFELTNNRG